MRQVDEHTLLFTVQVLPGLLDVLLQSGIIYSMNIAPYHHGFVLIYVFYSYIVLLITFNLPGPSFFFTYQHSQKKNEKPKYTLKTRKYNLTLQFQASVSH